MRSLYKEVISSIVKYIVLRNIFIVSTGLLNILIVRLLGPSEFGKYSIVWNLISTIGPILSLGWLNTLAKYVAEKNTVEEKSALLFQALVVVIFNSVLFILLFGISYGFFSNFFPTELREVILIFCLFVITVPFFNVLEGFWRGLGKFNEFVVIDGLRSNLGNIIGILLLLVFYPSYKFLIKANFLISLIFLIFLFLVTIKFTRWCFKFELSIFKFSTVLFIGQLVYMLSTNIDILLLRGILKDPQQVGFFVAAVRIPKLIEAMVINQITAPILYYFSSSETAFFKDEIVKLGCRILGTLSGLLGLLFFDFAKFIIPLLFGKEFLESVLIFRYFSLSLPLIGFFILLNPFYVSNNKPLNPIIINFLSFVLMYNMINFFTIQKYKAFALVISYLISFAFYSIVIMADLNKHFKLKLYYEFFLIVFVLIFSVFLSVYLKILSSLVFVILVFFAKIISLEELKRFFNQLLSSS